MTLDEILDEPFLGIALESFITQARLEQGWPCPEKTRQRCYEMYEAEKRKVDKHK